MKKNILMIAILGTMGASLGTSAFAQKIYRYVGANGQIVYSDNIPANEKGKIEVLASSTMALKDIQEKELSEDEYLAKVAIEEEQKVAKKTSEVEKQKNQALMNQYNSVNDIDKLKEYELQQINRTLDSNQEVLTALKRNKESINTELSKNKGKVPARIEKELADIESNIKNVENAVESNRNAYETREKKYDEDKKRYIAILEQMGKK